MDPEGRIDIELFGGTANLGRVVRRGETVRRPVRANSEGVHALLRHLEEVGFDGAPRFLGIDERGREVLSYIPGEPVTPPFPAWALTDEALRSVARLLRRYHEAAAEFDTRPHVWPMAPPRPFTGHLACHNDPNLANVIFRDGQAVALIDFDLASPAQPVWDVAAAVRLWAPLRSEEYIEDARRGDAVRRMQVFLAASGPAGISPERLIDAVIAHQQWLYGVVAGGATTGNPGFLEYWRRGLPRVVATREWCRANRGRLIAAAALG